jgi:hypothetical protein
VSSINVHWHAFSVPVGEGQFGAIDVWHKSCVRETCALRRVDALPLLLAAGEIAFMQLRGRDARRGQLQHTCCFVLGMAGADVY